MFFMAITIYIPGLALSAVTPLSITVTIIITGAVCTFYTSLVSLCINFLTVEFSLYSLSYCSTTFLYRQISSDVPKALDTFDALYFRKRLFHGCCLPANVFVSLLMCSACFHHSHLVGFLFT